MAIIYTKNNLLCLYIYKKRELNENQTFLFIIVLGY